MLSPLNVKRVFITGGSGFIGSHIISNNPETIFYNYDLKPFYAENVVNTSNLDYIKEVDLVIDLADIVGVNNVEKIDYLKAINTHKKIFELCKTFSRYLIYFSSSEIFGSNKNINEDSDFKIFNDKRGEYSLIKLHCESLIKNMLDHYMIIRPFNVVGLNQNPEKSCVVKFIKNAVENKDIEVFGNAVRCYTYIDDFVTCLCSLINKRFEYNKECFNVGNSSNKISTKLLAKEVIQILNSNSKIKYLKPRIPDVDVRVLDNKKVVLSAEYNFKHSIKMIIKQIGEQYAKPCDMCTH